MNIAFVTVYGEKYTKDRLFDLSACEIGQNLLLPNIELKKELERRGHQCHTSDLFKRSDIDIYVFLDIPRDSIYTINTGRKIASYFYHKKWKHDYLRNSLRSKKKKILQINEPPTVMPLSHNIKYHKYFDRIITWDDHMAQMDQKKYVNIKIPQPKPDFDTHIPFEEKKLVVIMAGNKNSNFPGSLYNKRKEMIEYLDENCSSFDLYGPGWESENLKCYRGFVNDKLKTLSNYKYCVCYENIYGLKGYITEKIFDCFFAGIVPIYLGASNIHEYIPDDTFVDASMFNTPLDMFQFITSMEEEKYEKYIFAAKQYVVSELFQKSFSVTHYVNEIMEAILN